LRLVELNYRADGMGISYFKSGKGWDDSVLALARVKLHPYSLVKAEKRIFIL